MNKTETKQTLTRTGVHRAFSLLARTALLLLALTTTAKAWAAYSPTGKIEECRGGLHRIYVKGYAYDPDDENLWIKVQVKVFTDAECKNLYKETPEMDFIIDMSYFEATIDNVQVGTYYVKVIAFDRRGNDPATQLGPVSVTLRDPITTPMELTSTTGAIYVGTGCVLTGTGGADTQVTIAEGTTVTLSGATITGIADHKWAGITCEGDATIILADGTSNAVKGSHEHYPGIYIPKGYTLTIRGNGSLDARSGSGPSPYTGETSAAAGIGGGFYGSADARLLCGNIVIEGGNITAVGGVKAAGIGNGESGGSCNITITGGNITAIGGKFGAGIGGGFYRNSGNITITGGTINATGGEYAAGIGGGKKSTCGNITISAGVISVTATAGQDAPNSIGNGTDGSCGTVSLGGAVTGCVDRSTFTFTPSQDMRSVSFDANYGTGTMTAQPFVTGLPTTLNACSFTRAGYTFIGWDTQAEGGGDAYTDRQNITITADMTLYAQWQKNPIVTFDKNADDATGTMADQEFVTSRSQDLNACSFARAGYGFVRWTTQADGGGDAYTDRQHIAISADMTLYAQWGKIHTVSFDSNGGSGTMDEQQFTEGISQALNACSFIFPEHKSFDKWTTQEDGGGTSYADKQSIDITGDMTLYAQWVASPIVTFNANGGAGSMAPQEFTAGRTQSLNANTFTREGYVFIGWATNPDGGGDTYINKQEIGISTDMTLYARWLQHTATTVTLSSSSGDVMLYDGDVLTGTGGTNTRVSIADGSTVTLLNANVTYSINSGGFPDREGISCEGDATIILADGTNNEVKGALDYPGIYVPEKRTLTIRGSGSLTVTVENVSFGNGFGYSDSRAAAIGSGYQGSCGNITIAGGIINATGGDDSSAIGSGEEASCGNITIAGGTIKATGGNNAAAIGSGNSSSCGNITISGGTINATGGKYAAAIGSGKEASCGNILLTGGTISATIIKELGVACIGCGDAGNCGDITISGGVTSVTTQIYKDYYQVHYGKSEYNYKGTCGTVTIHRLLSDVTMTNENTKTRTISGGPVLELIDSEDNSDAIAEAALSGTTYNTLQLSDRTLYRDGDWNTLCLPFDVTIAGSLLAGADVRELSSGSLEDGTLTLNFTEKDAVTAIEAGKPYLVKWGTTPDLVISSEAMWNFFALNVNNGMTYEGKIVKLAADIVVSEMVGTSEHPFKGVFDGDGHTMMLSITDESNYCTAPFRRISGATIKNVRTTGTVTGNLHCAGLVGATSGVNSINNCEVAADVVCSGGTHSHCGGILGHGSTSTTTITDCLFSGSITGTTTATGIIYGWGDNGTHTIENCLSAGNYSGANGVDLLKKADGTEIIKNCYRKTSGGSQGSDASGMTASELVNALGSGWEISGDDVVPKMNNLVLSDITNPVFSGVTVSSTEPTAITFEGGCFVGNYSPFSVVASGATKPDEGNINEIIFLGADSQLGYATEPRTLRPFRAHFYVPIDNNGGQSVKGYKLSFGDEASSIQNSKFINSKTKIQNYPDAWYSLDGIKLQGKPTRKGIYIHNGKRIVVK